MVGWDWGKEVAVRGQQLICRHRLKYDVMMEVSGGG